MAPKYQKPGKSLPKSAKVRVSVGPANTGFFNLKKSVKGQKGVSADSAPLIAEAWRWKSVRRYHKEALSGQIKTLTQQINDFALHIGTNQEKVLYNALQPTFNKSRVYCPKDKGFSDPLSLVNSARLEITQSKKGAKSPSATVAISYGVRGLPFYAVFVHEILSYHHDSPTRSKFLESAMREDMPKIKEALMDGLKKVSGA